MRIHSPIITGSFVNNLNGGSFHIANGPTTLFSITSAGIILLSGNITSSGNIAASTYYGDGSNLSGIGSVPFPYTGSATVSGSFIISGSLSVSGSIFATDKSFEIPHPTQPDKRLIYGVLEGPEHAVYYRGKTESNIIELPEEWTGLVDESTITVHLTPIGCFQSISVNYISGNKIYLQSEDHIKCYYLIHGTRKDIDKLQTVRQA
jgi:hypothetical protein